jgi:hypothetical protein
MPLLGGGGGGGGTNGAGGGGGGAVYLAAERELIVNGVVDVHGAEPEVVSGGAGAGGTIVVEAGFVQVGGVDGRFLVGSSIGADAAGAGRLRIRRLQPQFLTGGPLASEIADVGASLDEGFCTAVVDFAGARGTGEDEYRAPPPAPLALVDLETLVSGFDPSVFPLGPTLVASSPQADGQSLLVLADTDTAVLITPTSVVPLAGSGPYDAVAIDASAGGMIALGGDEAASLYQLNGSAIGGVTLTGRPAGSRLAVAGTTLLSVAADGHTIDVRSASPTTLDATEPITALVARGDALMVGIDGGTEQTRGVRYATRPNATTGFTVVASHLNFRAPPEALAMGLVRVLGAERRQLIPAGAPLDDACFTDSGGVVMFNLAGAGAVTRDDDIINPYDPRTLGQFGSSVAAGRTIAVHSMGAAGAMITVDGRGDHPVIATASTPTRAVGFARNLVVVVANDGAVLAAAVSDPGD